MKEVEAKVQPENIVSAVSVQQVKKVEPLATATVTNQQVETAVSTAIAAVTAQGAKNAVSQPAAPPPTQQVKEKMATDTETTITQEHKMSCPNQITSISNGDDNAKTVTMKDFKSSRTELSIDNVMVKKEN